MVQRKMGVSAIGSFPFKYSHFPLKHDYGGRRKKPAGQKKRPQILLLFSGQDLAMKHGAKMLQKLKLTYMASTQKHEIVKFREVARFSFGNAKVSVLERGTKVGVKHHHPPHHHQSVVWPSSPRKSSSLLARASNVSVPPTPGGVTEIHPGFCGTRIFRNTEKGIKICCRFMYKDLRVNHGQTTKRPSLVVESYGRAVATEVQAEGMSNRFYISPSRPL